MKYPIDIILHVLNTKGARSIKEACKCLNWLGEVDALARDVYALIRRGPTPVEEAPLEPEDDDPFPDAPEESLGVLSAEDDDAN